MLFAGHPQIAYYALLVTAAWACVLVFRRRGTEAQEGGPGRWVFVLP